MDNYIQTIHAGKIKNMILDKCDPLTREEELTASNHDLVKHNLRFMIKTFNAYLKYMSFSEYISEIISAMYIAAERYDRKSGNRFNTYARNWVSVVLWEYKRKFSSNYYNNVSICASTWKKLIKLKNFKHKFIVDNGKPPTEKDYEAEFKDYSKDLLKKHIFLMNNGYEMSTDEVVSNDKNKSISETTTFGDTLSYSNVYSEDEFLNPDEEFEKKEMIQHIFSKINNMDELHRKVAHCLYVDNMSKSECAKFLNINKPRVANINEDIISTLRKQFV